VQRRSHIKLPLLFRNLTHGKFEPVPAFSKPDRRSRRAMAISIATRASGSADLNEQRSGDSVS